MDFDQKFFEENFNHVVKVNRESRVGKMVEEEMEGSAIPFHQPEVARCPAFPQRVGAVFIPLRCDAPIQPDRIQVRAPDAHASNQRDR